jgi:hypothetical protein
MDLGEMVLGIADWSGLPQYRDQQRALLGAVMNLQVAYNAGKFLSDCTTDSLSSSAHLHLVGQLVG